MAVKHARVMVHAFTLLEATGSHEEGPRLWATVYLQDIARTHDGRCFVHGAQAIEKLETMEELDRSHPHWRLASLLKDADGLDRVRLGDMDPRFLRHRSHER